VTDFKKVIVLAKPYTGRIIIGVILSFLASALTGAIAWVVKPALDHVFIEKRYEYLRLLPVLLVFLYIIKGFFEFGQTYMMKSVGFKIVRDVRNRIYARLLIFPVGYFTRESSGKILSRIINDVNILSGTISKILVTFFLEFSQVLILAGVALYRRWDLTLLTILLFPFAAFGAKKFGRRVKRKVKDAQQKISDVTERVTETVSGIKIIKVFNHEKESERAFVRENQAFYRDMMKVVRLKEFTRVFIYGITGTSLAVILWYGGSLVVNDTITPGDFISILTALFMMFSPIRKLGEAYSIFQEVIGALERIEVVYDIKEEKGGTLKIDTFNNSIVFDHIFFRYPETEHYVLNDINLEIAKGEVIAIVGPSGAGKTTFIDLIPRFYLPSKGRIFIDNYDIKTLHIHSLRGLIGIVSQEIVLFDDTIKENIKMGNIQASMEQILHASEMSYCQDFIKEFPEGYDTVVGERGARLSGGQKQRIAIARALIKNPPILILDEATSSLDSVSEFYVQKALESLMKDRTTIIVAHRLSTIRDADRIIVLEKGRMVDVGTHEQLIDRNNVYMSLYSNFAAQK
jgi:subfamily B ATP-binding cassette protein MsbA